MVLEPILLARSPLRPAFVQMSLHCEIGSWYSDLRRMVLEPTLEAPLAALREKQQPIVNDVNKAKVESSNAQHWVLLYATIGIIDCLSIGDKNTCADHPFRRGLC